MSSFKGGRIGSHEILSRLGEGGMGMKKYIVGTPSKTVTRCCSMELNVASASKRSFKTSLRPKKKALFNAILP